MTDYAALPTEKRRQICKAVVGALQRVHTYTEIEIAVNERNRKWPPPPVASFIQIIDAINDLQARGIVDIEFGNARTPDVITIAPRKASAE